jgi:hypothetical protein
LKIVSSVLSPEKVIIVHCKIPYNSPSLGGRELEGRGFHLTLRGVYPE